MQPAGTKLLPNLQTSEGSNRQGPHVQTPRYGAHRQQGLGRTAGEQKLCLGFRVYTLSQSSCEGVGFIGFGVFVLCRGSI